MADVQHSALTDPNIHEPKGVATATVSKVYVANGAGTGIWRKLVEDDLDFTTPASNKFGWNFRVDSTYTSGAPLSCPATVKTLCPNDGLVALSNITRPIGVTYTTNNFTPTNLNSSYVMRLSFKIKASAAAGTPYVVKVSLEGGAVPLEFTANTQFVKGASYINEISHDYLFFTGSLNTNQPVTIYLTADTDCTVYDIRQLLQRTYVEV